MAVPSLAAPRLLVPAGFPRAAAAAVRRSTAHGTLRARARTAALSALFRTGAGERVFRSRLSVPDRGTIEEHLATVLGAPVLLSLHIGPARANRKPVFAVLGPRGQPLGFAKVGVDDLTRRLVRDEARALAVLAERPLRQVEVAAVLHHGRWHGCEVLVQSALPVRRRRIGAGRLVGAMVEVAVSGGVRGEPVDGAYGARLAERVAEVAGKPGAAVLGDALAEALSTGARLRIGCWHGDWNAGNTAARDGRVLVWDWERFDDGVPLGFDALHHDLLTAITVRHVGAPAAAASTCRRAAALLAPFGVAAADAPVVATLYLVELGVRYLADGQAEAGARLGRIHEWMAPALRGSGV
ncbi:MAG TPA: hypothetical protein VGD72_03235 [Mycobacteriales bacterium]